MDFLELAGEISQRPSTGRGITVEVLDKLCDEMAEERPAETNCLPYEEFKVRVLEECPTLAKKLQEAWEQFSVILMAASTGRCTESEVKQALKNWFFLVCEGRKACNQRPNTG